MAFFDGLYSYEIVLMVLGVLLFLVLLGAFVYLIITGKPWGKLLAFFAIPIAMIGFSAISSIQFGNGVVTIETAVPDLQKDPTNAPLRDTVSKQLAQVANRPTKNPSAITAIAKAQFALGDPAAAETNLQKALQTAPQLPEALALKKRIDLDHRLTSLTEQAKQHPDDDAIKTNLQTTLSEAASLSIASPLLLAHIARAHAAVGNRAAALSFADKALAIDPKLKSAMQVREQMQAKGTELGGK